MKKIIPKLLMLNNKNEINNFDKIKLLIDFLTDISGKNY